MKSAPIRFPAGDPLDSDEQANRHTLTCIDFTGVAMLFIWALTMIDVFILDKQVTTNVLVLTLLTILVANIGCKAAGYTADWVKYFLITCTEVELVIGCTALSYHYALIFALPLFYAAQYRTRRVMVVAYVMTVAAMSVGVLASYTVGLCDLNMLFLSRYPTSFYANRVTGEIYDTLAVNPNPRLTIPLYFIFPRAVILLLFVQAIRRIIDNSESHAMALADLRRLSETDRATRFYNRNKYLQMVSGYYKTIDRVGVIFWDINNLKIINDTYGHTQGDVIISSLAACIYAQTDNLRKVYRIGGDEFVMILENPEENELQSVISAVAEHIAANNVGSRILLSCAVGFAEGAGYDIKTVIDEADQNMYANKVGCSNDDRVHTQSGLLDDALFEAYAQISDNVYTFICDMNTGISRWGRSAVEYFDMPGEFMKDVEQHWLQRIHPEDRARLRTEYTEIFSGKKLTHNCEYRAVNRYGKYVWLQCRGIVTHDSRRGGNIFTGFMLRLDVHSKYDPLTKMKNFAEYNEDDFASRPGSMLLIDLDDFRRVINNFGYAYSDQVLLKFAERVMDFCLDRYLCFRVDSDEFLILCGNQTPLQLERIFTSLRALAHDLGPDEEQKVSLCFSGSAVFYPQDGTTREELLTNLEHSMEQAKHDNRGGLTFFSDSIARAHQRSQVIRQAVGHALHSGYQGFELYFQPIVSADDLRIVSCEALLRFTSSEIDNGICTNIEEIVHHIEESGEILPVGRWIVEEVFRNAQLWQKEYPSLSIAFNVSMLQFAEDTFVDHVIHTADIYRVDPRRIIIELTESYRAENLEMIAAALSRLRTYGFKIALDDFGIGYSTLLLIKTMPADIVKIDHNFVISLAENNNDIDLAIIESVIKLCTSMNILVVAEGVENVNTLDILRKYPISYYQGYYFSRPVPQSQFKALLSAQPADAHEKP